MKVALIGYGKMGKIIHELLDQEPGNEVFILGKDRPAGWEKVLASCDVAIEFTNPDQVLQNLETCFSLGVPVVTGTTGWQAELPAVSASCTEQNGTLFYASNFSVGVHLFVRMNAWMAEFMEQHTEYSLMLEEEHHIHKKDAPSGTAIWVAEEVIKHRKDLTHWTSGSEQSADGLPIHAIREGETIGKHSVHYTSSNDEIIFTHNAFNRKGFAAGAIVAAKFILQKQGVFTMQDLLNLR
jgi:4-hydroxy-tetrahydrodipicolinate reductase